MNAQTRLPWVAQSFRHTFEAHAAPDSIQAHLAARRSELAALGQEIAWLEGLLAQRSEAGR